MTHVKTTKDSSNKYEPIFVLKHEALYEGLRKYFMSLMPKEQVHAVVVSIHNMILNEIKTKRYQEQIYIVPMDIVNFMLGTHGVKYTDKTTNKAYRFDIEQYAHHRQFLNKRKLASHPFLFVPIFNGGHWWLWIADVNKKKFYVLDPINKKPEDIPDSRKELKKFVGLIIFQMRVYAGAEPLMEDGLGKEAEYIQLNGQREENRQKFRRTFVVFVQMCFLLRTTVSMASAIHKPPIFCVNNIQQWDWASNVLGFLRNGIENMRKGKKQSVEGCVFVLMLIYFHETKFPRLDGLDALPAPWVAYWTKKMMLD
ncbi:hypothetical protein Ahy_B02g058269 [Arachis hypogaea]|uniref:Ubiquitin-like protease family profile domain-containing protein n=1 Tax=Arachis hypogaea TaxID=3818 RepID=A0A445AE94_ARAHY|nr:hypothetical protein Ahy_B02g058269 [Arachis hypogaea]